jgi:hypothetical protein
MKVLQGLIIFLAVALVIFVGTTVMFAFRCNYLHALKDDEKGRIEQLEADNKALITEKLQLSIKYDELYDDNVALTAAIKELREINKELMNDETVQDISPAPAETVKATGLLPENVHTNMFRCEPFEVIEDTYENDLVYKSAFIEGSHQNKLQKECQTDPETGIRYYDDGQTKWLCAALAGAYGTEIGHAYMFTLANGTVIPVIMSDFKHPIDNVRADDYGDVDKNYLGDDCINVIEFVVDMDAIPQVVKQAGTMSALARFGGLYSHEGNIIEVKDEGRVWTP